MYGALADIHTLVYSFLKKSGSSSGGIILPRPPRPGPGLRRGFPMKNQKIAPNEENKNMIINHAHFGNLRTSSWGLLAQSKKA